MYSSGEGRQAGRDWRDEQDDGNYEDKRSYTIRCSVDVEIHPRVKTQRFMHFGNHAPPKPGPQKAAAEVASEREEKVAPKVVFPDVSSKAHAARRATAISASNDT